MSLQNSKLPSLPAAGRWRRNRASKADCYTQETMLLTHLERTSQTVGSLPDLVCSIALQSGCRPRAQKGLVQQLLSPMLASC